MDWEYTIVASPEPRLLMRVALIFDQQRLTVKDLVWRCSETRELVEVHVCVFCDEALARRMHAKLYHLQDVRDARLSGGLQKRTQEQA